MDIDRQNLKEVEAEIKALVKTQTKLKKKRNKGRLDDDQEIELEGVDTLIQKLEVQQKNYAKFIELSIKATSQQEDESVTFKEATASDIASIAGINTVREPWTDVLVDETVIPSDSFFAQYQMNCRVWSMNSEASRRTVLDLFLRDVVAREEFRCKLRIFCELPMTTAARLVGTKRRKLTGKHDYTIGHAGGIDMNDYSAPPDSHIIAVEAKKAWDEADVWQCIAEAAALYRIRKDAGKRNCNVWGICSNASLWKFVHIDNDGQIWVSKDTCLEVPSFNREQILKVYRFVHHIVMACFETSPTTTPQQSSMSLAG